MPKSSIKRVVVKTRKGQEAWYYKNGKRIPNEEGKRKWVSQEYELLANPWRRPQLTKDEQKTFLNSKRQRDLFRYKGKPIKRAITEVMLATEKLKPTDNREITKIFDGERRRFRDYGTFEQVYQALADKIMTTNFTSVYGAAGYRGRETHQSAVSILEGLMVLGSENWKLAVVDLDGNLIQGREKAMEVIMRFEMEATEELIRQKGENVAAVFFPYKLKWDFKKKLIIVDLNNVTPEPGYSEPKGRDSKAQKVNKTVIKERKRR